MPWLYFVLGFVAFPILAVAFFIAVRLLSQAPPVEVSSPLDLQSQLRGLLDNGKDGETLFVVWLPLRFELRVHKRVRKSQADTLWLELRNSDSNRDHYAAACKALESSSIDFAESLTAARRRPRRLRIAWPSGGPLVVSSLSHAVEVIQSALPPEPPSRRLASRHHPSLWRRRPVAAV